MLKRFTMLGSLSVLLALAAIPAVASPVDDVSDFTAAVNESAGDNQAYTSSNISTANGAACSITPYDAVAATFRSAGYGTEQVEEENVVVKAVDHAVYQVECDGRDTDAFTATAEYWFEARMQPNVWERVSREFSCAADSLPGGTIRIQAAAFAVPGNLACDFRQIYEEDDPFLSKPHRLHVHLTTTNGVDMHGLSLPWPSRSIQCFNLPICP